jgi:hypothetical protein
MAWRFSAMNGSKGFLLILVLFQADQSQSDCLGESGGGGQGGAIATPKIRNTTRKTTTDTKTPHRKLIWFREQGSRTF